MAAEINGVSLQAKDDTFTSGRVALLADVPARFDDLQIFASSTETARLEKTRSDWHASESAAADAQPKPKLWRIIKTPQYGTDRNLRFGDLTGNNQIDILIGQIFQHGPTDSNSELGA